MAKNKKKDDKSQTAPNINIQRYAFQLTINNPKAHGFPHDVIRKTLVNNFSTLYYFCMSDEQGSCYHTHIYIYFTSRVRFSKIAKHFPTAHIEPAYGTVQNNIDYIRKSRKWKDTDKAETRIPNTFEEFGTVPKQKGHKPDMEELYRMVSEGLSNAEIFALNNDYILDATKIDQLRLALMQDKYKSTRRLDIHVTYCYGATGLGKTRGILDYHGDANVCRVTDYKRAPFSGYTSFQPVLMFDEYRSQLPISDLLIYLDVYPIELPSRYSNHWAAYTYVYIVSNWSLEMQYEDVQKESPESWNAFLRRIHEVKVHQEDGTVVTYASVEEYMNRKNDFTQITNDITVPFE